jgi:hypothetical protein
MDRKHFWEILDMLEGYRDDGARYEALVDKLSRLPAEEIVDFARLYDELAAAAHRTDLWGAASLINGGASDDGFHYFCVWLVGQGRQVYEAAVRDPDTLADVVDPDDVAEGDLDGAAGQAWVAKTGRTEDDFHAALEQRRNALERRRKPRAQPAADEDWDFEDEEELRRRFPRLAAMYLPEDEE